MERILKFVALAFAMEPPLLPWSSFLHFFGDRRRETMVTVLVKKIIGQGNLSRPMSFLSDHLVLSLKNLSVRRIYQVNFLTRVLG